MKNYTPEQHDTLAEYLQRMQKGLGHHSWWYTNRGPADCVNVKMHCWVDTDELTALLTEREKKAVEVLKIDVAEWAEEYKWSGISWEANNLAGLLQEAEALKHKDFTVTDVEYGGRSGGWACIVFDFYGLGDYLEGSEYAVRHLAEKNITKKELAQWHRQALAARDYIEKVHDYVKQAHKELCAYYKNPQTYIEALKDYIANCIDHEAATIERKAENLRKLAQAS